MIRWHRSNSRDAGRRRQIQSNDGNKQVSTFQRKHVLKRWAGLTPRGEVMNRPLLLCQGPWWLQSYKGSAPNPSYFHCFQRGKPRGSKEKRPGTLFVHLHQRWRQWWCVDGDGSEPKKAIYLKFSWLHLFLLLEDMTGHMVKPRRETLWSPSLAVRYGFRTTSTYYPHCFVLFCYFSRYELITNIQMANGKSVLLEVLFYFCPKLLLVSITGNLLLYIFL